MEEQEDLSLPKLAFYITSHGFGHLFRSLEAVKFLVAEFDVFLVSTLPSVIIEQELGFFLPSFSLSLILLLL